MLKNITLSAEESLIAKARRRAADERKSLNELFRDWMARYVGGEKSSADYRRLMSRLSHVRPGRHFSREELNER